MEMVVSVELAVLSVACVRAGRVSVGVVLGWLRLCCLTMSKYCALPVGCGVSMSISRARLVSLLRRVLNYGCSGSASLHSTSPSWTS